MEYAILLFRTTGTTRSGDRSGSTRFFDNRPLPPGGSQVVVSFDLDPQRIAGGYRHRALYPTELLELLVQPATVQPGPPFENLGVEEVHGTPYRRLQVRDLQPGQEILVPLPVSSPRRWVLKWAALGGALLAGCLALFLGQRGRGAPGAEGAQLQGQWERLLQQLADLDDEYAERPEHPRYRSSRSQLMDEAMALRQRLGELPNG